LENIVNHKVKKIVVFPQRKLSLQKHKYQFEHWYIIQGKAIVKKDNDELYMSAGTSIDIQKECWHLELPPINRLPTLS